MTRWLLAVAMMIQTLSCSCGDDDPSADPDAGDAGGDSAADGGGDVDCDPLGTVPDPSVCTPAEARQVALASDLPAVADGDAVAGIGDFLLRNDRLSVYFDDIGNANVLSPGGGTIIDLIPAGQDVDHFGQLSSIFFVEQGNFIVYDEIAAEVTEEGIARVTVRGTVRGGPQGDLTGELEAETRYELRPCESHVRIWTDVTNVSNSSISGGLGTMVTDVILWGSRGMQPFCPGVPGQGYACPGFDAGNPLGSIGFFPYIGAAATFAGPFSLALIPLNQDGALFGVNDDQVSGVGAGDAIAAPLAAGQTRTYGRALIVATERNDVASASNLAFEAHARCGGEPVGTACLSLTMPDPLPFASGDRRNGSVLFYRPGTSEPHDVQERIPMTHAIPDADGGVRVTLPEGTYYYEIEGPGGAISHGGPIEVSQGTDGECVQAVMAPPAYLSVELLDPLGQPLPGRVVLKGLDGTPDPLMGPARGGSPAGNQALVGANGTLDLALPPGRYRVYGTHGIEWSLAEQEVELTQDGAAVQLTLEEVVDTSGMLSADMHVHSVLSWDSSLPLTDRVLAYVAEGVDVIIATEHDVIGDYGPTVQALGMGSLIATIPGLESTGAVITDEFPHTIGHHNAWPLEPAPEQPRDGAPPDEHSTVPELYARLRAAGAEVVQLNHGRSSTVGSVWLGWLDSCGFDPSLAIDQASGCDLGEWDVMEVMNGHDVAKNFMNRQDWFAFLSQLPFIPGTANSDSHRLIEQEAGYPRNYVLMNDDLAAFDPAEFDDAVRAGRLFGTSGPILRVTASGPLGNEAGPGELLVAGPNDSIELHVQLQAAPWIPVDEVVVYANGQVVSGVAAGDLAEAVMRYDGALGLGPLGEDAWIVVEAGTPWPGDGEPPTPPEPLGTIAPGTVPHAFTNPIFITADGDGDFDLPGLP